LKTASAVVFWELDCCGAVSAGLESTCRFSFGEARILFTDAFYRLDFDSYCSPCRLNMMTYETLKTGEGGNDG
jgi:hypothetical protein